MEGKLYLVATPIGNLEDITLRALRILKQVDIIAAEDTRQTLKLLNHFEIAKPLISYYRHNETQKIEQILQKLQEGQTIALVSDAGTPAISDPGEELVKKAIEKKIQVVPVPGACAAITALIASGQNTRQFLFLGFLPLNKKYRKEVLEEIQNAKQTCILYEAPHKLLTTLKDLKERIGNRKVVLARELTKIHEEFLEGTIAELIEKVTAPRGEYVLLIEGRNTNSDKREKTFLTIEEQYKRYQEEGYDKKEIIKKIAKDKKVTKNEIYQHFLKQKE